MRRFRAIRCANDGDLCLRGITELRVSTPKSAPIDDLKSANPQTTKLYRWTSGGRLAIRRSAAGITPISPRISKRATTFRTELDSGAPSVRKCAPDRQGQGLPGICVDRQIRKVSD
jgi:hypothetical protein